MNAAISQHTMPVAPQWWPVSLVERVTREKPLGMTLGSLPIVLFRDHRGIVRALEDRCAHRRVPLSLGRVTPEGRLQCGYHGWTYDGETGTCTAIPHLGEDTPIPKLYRVLRYRAVEHNGFVYVWTGDPERAPALPPEREIAMGHRGSTVLPLGYEDVLATLLDGPQVLLRTAGVQLNDYFIRDLQVHESGSVSVERGALWSGRSEAYHFVSDYPLVFRTTLDGERSEALLELLTDEEVPLYSTLIGLTPSARGTTTMHWRCRVFNQARGARAVLLRTMLGVSRRAPLAPRTAIDGAALVEVLPGPSLQWKNLRQRSPRAMAAVTD
jgi:nitrite reductase/ring-hydroxylating ferredoxin subunit